MEKIWFAEYRKTGIPETVELPAENTSLVDIFERNFQKFGSRDAFIFMDKVLSFSELEEASRKFATYLQSLGLAPGACCGDDAERTSISRGCVRGVTCRLSIGEREPTLYFT